jgi:hypothetical protein
VNGSGISIAILWFCLACQQAAPNLSQPASGASATPVVSLPPDTSDTSSFELRPEPVDSNAFSWIIPSAGDVGRSRFTGDHVRHPSGLTILWLDTAIRATEDKPAGTVHVDSIVVSGILHGEFLTPHCNADGKRESWVTQIVGIVHDSSTYTRPRLAWMLDTGSNRIRAIPTDPVLCSASDMFSGGDVDP